MLLSLWPFSCEYFARNWAVLGGDHFIALCTGVNIALIGWQAFQDRVRYAERQLEAKINSISASLVDLDSAKYEQLVAIVLQPVRLTRIFGWRCVYALAIVAALVGTALLYCHQSSPYDLFLLLPTTIQLTLSWITLGLLVFWMWLMRKGMVIFGPCIPSRQTATDEVQTYAAKTRKSLGEQEPGQDAKNR